MWAYSGVGSNNRHCRARVESVNARLRTARIFLMDEGLEVEDIWDNLKPMRKKLPQAGLAIKIELACVAALPLAAPPPPAGEEYIVSRSSGGRIVLMQTTGSKKSLNEDLIRQALKLGGGRSNSEALIQGFEYAVLPQGEGRHFVLHYSSQQMLFVVADTALDRCAF